MEFGFFLIFGTIAISGSRAISGNWEHSGWSPVSGTQFRGTSGPANVSRKKPASPGLSVKLAKTIGNLSSVEEFLGIVHDVPKEQMNFFSENKDGGVARLSGVVAKPAFCMPELQPVTLNEENGDPSIVYFPTCTRVRRCGGCCSHPLLACEPKARVMTNFIAVMSKLTPDGELEYGEKVIVPLEEHTKCECACRVKKEHCTIKQEYVESECSCKCLNVDEEEKCAKEELKLWDPNVCACRCRSEYDCFDGWDFNPETCKCEKLRYRGLPADSWSRGSSPRNPPYGAATTFVPPAADDSRRRPNRDDPEYR